jgi:hypothetical protein
MPGHASSSPPDESAPRACKRASPVPADLALLLLAAVPGVAAILACPRFATQDGPAHLYNAQILADAIGSGATQANPIFLVQWQPLPNWAGHAALILLLKAGVPAFLSDRILTLLTWLGFSFAVISLRLRVSGRSPGGMAGAIALLLGLNVSWLFGFTSFLIGSTLGLATLGFWWTSRERLSPQRAVFLVTLLFLVYFSHLVSFVLTSASLLILAAFEPRARRAWRLAKTFALLLPLAPLGLWYLTRSSRAEGFAPVWGTLRDPFSLNDWRDQLTWVDPLSLGQKARLPLLGYRSPLVYVVSPVVLLCLAALMLLAFARMSRVREASRTDSPSSLLAWIALAIILILGGILAPDTLGPSQGNYLPQRITLWGLAVGLVSLPLGALGPNAVRLVAIPVAAAWAIQSSTVWDYALYCNRELEPFHRAREWVRPGDRVGTLLVGIRGPYRSNPLLHADNLVGIGTGALIWNNYETVHPYFPVQLRTDLPHPDPAAFESIHRLDDPVIAPDRLERWESLLSAHVGEIDRLLTWGTDAALDRVNVRWYEVTNAWGNLRLWDRRRPISPAKPAP